MASHAEDQEMARRQSTARAQSRNEVERVRGEQEGRQDARRARLAGEPPTRLAHGLDLAWRYRALGVLGLVWVGAYSLASAWEPAGTSVVRGQPQSWSAGIYPVPASFGALCLAAAVMLYRGRLP